MSVINCPEREPLSTFGSVSYTSRPPCTGVANLSAKVFPFVHWICQVKLGHPQSYEIRSFRLRFISEVMPEQAEKFKSNLYDIQSKRVKYVEEEGKCTGSLEKLAQKVSEELEKVNQG